MIGHSLLVFPWLEVAISTLPAACRTVYQDGLVGRKYRFRIMHDSLRDCEFPLFHLYSIYLRRILGLLSVDVVFLE